MDVTVVTLLSAFQNINNNNNNNNNDMTIVKTTMYGMYGPETKEIVAINKYKISKEVTFGRNKAIMLLGDKLEIRDFYVDTCICVLINI
jgi:hypothetical protein